MQLHKGRLLQILLLTCVVAATLFTPVYAISANDIRGYYGLAHQQDIRPLQAEARELAKSIRTAEDIQRYNSLLASYPVEELEARVAEQSAELESIANSLKTDVSLAYEDILSLEAKYYNIREELDITLKTLQTVSGMSYVEEEEDLDALHESLASLQKAIASAGYFDDIGKLGVWPAKSAKRKYNSGFGSRWDPVTNKGISYHSGVDIYAPMSTPVIAEFSGTVYKTGYSVTSGNYIYLDHGHGVRSFYCHLSEILCTNGTNVTQGTVIAKSGNTGTRTTGPHLHFGIYIDGTAVDPKVVLDHD